MSESNVFTETEPKDQHAFIFQCRSCVLRLYDLLSHQDCRRNIHILQKHSQLLYCPDNMDAFSPTHIIASLLL